jgi:hypothetical protein
MCAAAAAEPSAVPSDDDAFSADAFDTAVSAAAAIDATNRLEYLPGISFVSDLSATRSLENPAYGSDARFYGKAFLKASRADVGALFLGVNYDYFLYAAAAGEPFSTFYELRSPDPSAIKTTLSEFHASFDVKKKVFIRIGSQLISWGSTYFWSPEDFINQQKAQAAVLSVVDTRAGKPGVRIHIPINAMNVFLFTDFSRVVQNNSAEPFDETVAQAVRVDGAFRGVNLGTVCYVAKNRPEKLGFDATGAAFGADLYGEIALEFTDALHSAPEYALSMGGSKLLGRERNWTVRTELYYNDAGYGDVAQSQLVPGAFTPFYSGKFYAYGEVGAVNLLSAVFSPTVFTYGNLADGSFSTTLLLTFDLPGVLPFTVYGRYYGGGNDREFTRAFGGQATGAGLRIRAEF